MTAPADMNVIRTHRTLQHERVPKQVVEHVVPTTSDAVFFGADSKTPKLVGVENESFFRTMGKTRWGPALKAGWKGLLNYFNPKSWSLTHGLPFDVIIGTLLGVLSGGWTIVGTVPLWVGVGMFFDFLRGLADETLQQKLARTMDASEKNALPPASKT